MRLLFSWVSATLMLVAIAINIGFLSAPSAGRDCSPVNSSNVGDLHISWVLGQGGLLSNLSWSPDGNALVLSGAIGTWLYEINNSDSEPHYLANLYYPIFSQDGTYLALSDGISLVVIESQSLQRIQTISRNSPDSISSLAFDPTGNLLASGDSSGYVQIWDITSGQQIFAFQIQDEARSIEVIKFDSEGRRLAVGSTRGDVSVWNLDNQAEIARFQLGDDALGSAIADIVFMDNTDLAVINRSGDFFLLNDGSIISARSLNDIISVEYTEMILAPQGNIVASGDVYGTIRILDVEQNELMGTLSGHSRKIDDLRFSPDGTVLASISEDRTLRLWNLPQMSEERAITFSGHPEIVESLVFHPNQNIIFSAGTNDGIRVWDAQNNVQLSILIPDMLSSVTSLDISPNGQYLAYGLWNPDGGRSSVMLHDRDTRDELIIFEGGSLNINSAAFGADGTLLAAGGLRDGEIGLWDLEHNSLLSPILSSGIISKVFVISSSRVISTTTDGTIQLWEISGNSRIEIASVVGFNVIYNPLDQVIGVKDEDRLILYSAETLEEAASFRFLGTPMAFNHNGDLIVSFEPNTSSLYFWETETGTNVATLDEVNSTVYDVAFNYADEIMATAHSDGTIKLWNCN
jgi:WD40 repeat protein